jgi:hypothetical protein
VQHAAVTGGRAGLSRAGRGRRVRADPVDAVGPAARPHSQVGREHCTCLRRGPAQSAADRDLPRRRTPDHPNRRRHHVDELRDAPEPRAGPTTASNCRAPSAATAPPSTPPGARPPVRPPPTNGPHTTTTTWPSATTPFNCSRRRCSAPGSHHNAPAHARPTSPGSARLPPPITHTAATSRGPAHPNNPDAGRGRSKRGGAAVDEAEKSPPPHLQLPRQVGEPGRTVWHALIGFRSKHDGLDTGSEHIPAAPRPLGPLAFPGARPQVVRGGRSSSRWSALRNCSVRNPAVNEGCGCPVSRLEHVRVGR